jgi:hypothetical protein
LFVVSPFAYEPAEPEVITSPSAELVAQHTTKQSLFCNIPFLPFDRSKPMATLLPLPSGRIRTQKYHNRAPTN